MEIKITVERRRGSVTQGMADVLINGEKVAEFGDTIELIHPGEKYYGELIGNWASRKPDTAFIRGLLFHPHDEVYHISDKAKAALNKVEAEETEGAAERPPRIEEIRQKYGWPKKIQRDGYIGTLVDVQPLNEGDPAPIYRFPGGDSVEHQPWVCKYEEE